MTSQKYRSRRTFRKIYKKVPGGATHVQYRRRKPGKAQCANCSRSLPGVPRMHAVQGRTMAKTMKRPERLFGGMLCSPCSRLKIIEMASTLLREKHD